MSERMVVAFRPEFASLGRPCENALAGKMTSIIYSGDLVRLHVELPNGDVIVVKRSLRLYKPIPNARE
ncbi:hypothetical protein DRO37_09370 [Candidatus Bathyarchaeota archaeon]|nr:MAG: hypothetical protein DRO37_09370 [Candidatus Bathyarchaeota archaeon]